MKRKKALFFILPILVLLLTWLLWPLSSRKWSLREEETLIARKEELLSRVPGSDGAYNILLITADDLGKYDTDLYGDGPVPVPHISSLAESGVLCTEAYATSPICAPSRAALLTGRYQQRNGFEYQMANRYPRNRLELFAYDHFVDLGDMHLSDYEGFRYPSKADKAGQGLPREVLTAGEIFSVSGMKTGLFGKWHLGYQSPFLPSDKGFQEFWGFLEAFSLYTPAGTEGIEEYRHDYFANKYIWNQERKGPSALSHNKDTIEDSGYLTFRLAEEANNYMAENRDEPFFIHLSFNAPHTPFQAPEKYYNRFPDAPDENHRIYYAMIAALDDAVGSVLAQVDDLGLRQKTLIVFASDNGGATYTGATDNGPLQGGKFSQFEGGIAVPLIISLPGLLPEGITYEPMVSLMDFLPTALDLTDSSPEGLELDGVSLLPYLTGAAEGLPHEALYWRSGFNKALRRGDWKLLADEKSETYHLYNLAADPGEAINVAEKHPEVMVSLLCELKTWEQGLKDPLWPHVMDYRFIINGEVFDFAL